MKHLITLLFLLPLSAVAETYTFPEDFQWCVATAGHQIEGDNIHSDWWAWEQIPGKIARGEKSGKAAYHIERLEEDVNLMKSLSVDTYRFSIEWSRIEPEQGKYDMEGVNHYLKEFALLKAKGIRPMVTIHHFVQPQWFTASGGWNREDSPEIFLSYVKKMEEFFGQESDYWITFNEPNVLLLGGFAAGFMPPGQTDLNLWPPLVNILKAHEKAYHYLHLKAKEQNRQIKVGMAYHLRPLIPGNWFLTWVLKPIDWFINWNMPNAVKTGTVTGFSHHSFLGIPFFMHESLTIPDLAGTQDFLGINYYTREKISLSFSSPYLHRDPADGTIGTDLNWGIDPQGFYNVLKKSHELFPDIPFYITESGLADEKDQWRADYVADHLRVLHKAMTEFNHKVEGYCYWSMMDNFEWQEGFEPRFGLFHVDYTKQGERTPRRSVKRVKRIYETNVLEFPDPDGAKEVKMDSPSPAPAEGAPPEDTKPGEAPPPAEKAL